MTRALLRTAVCAAVPAALLVLASTPASAIEQTGVVDVTGSGPSGTVDGDCRYAATLPGVRRLEAVPAFVVSPPLDLTVDGLAHLDVRSRGAHHGGQLAGRAPGGARGGVHGLGVGVVVEGRSRPRVDVGPLLPPQPRLGVGGSDLARRDGHHRGRR